jgi:superfamily II DNA/RNA helicase
MENKIEDMFQKLGLKESITRGLKKMGITVPTDIQAKAIPEALLNKDIIAQSETGSGKTLAYLLPIFQKIDIEKREMQALVLAPTHELAMQIFRTIETLANNSEYKATTAVIIGSANIDRQIERLREKPHIIVGSAGRVLELIKKKKISAHTIKTIVIDEGDRLLDINNIEDVKAVIKTTLKERQLLVYSATISNKTIEIAKGIMKEPEILKVESKEIVNSDIEHLYFQCDQRDKFETLRKAIRAMEPKKALVFINKSDDIEIIAEKLKYHKIKAEGLHGTNIRNDRKKAMQDFRAGRVEVLVASDIAARGLDVEGVTHVFNLDLPENPENYLHRVGRTGRAGKKGSAISIVTERELSTLKTYQNTYKIEIVKKELYKGKVVGIFQPNRSNK